MAYCTLGENPPWGLTKALQFCQVSAGDTEEVTLEAWSSSCCIALVEEWASTLFCTSHRDNQTILAESRNSSKTGF